MNRLFGTDGVRGVANKTLSPLLAYHIGRAFAIWLQENAPNVRRIFIGRDTRISGPMLEGTLLSGIASTGMDALVVGVIPTPGIAYLTRQSKDAAGVVISASHNPVIYNGFKLFAPSGFKLTEQQELAVERIVYRLAANQDDYAQPIGGSVGRVIPYPTGTHMYEKHLLSIVHGHRAPYTVVLDVAHGASAVMARRLFRRLGAHVVELHGEPNGININVQCGSTAPDNLQEAVVKHRAHVGFAFDGDADRVIAVDQTGQIVDGDAILAICARHLLEQNELPSKGIVATVYSNLGLTRYMENLGGTVVTTDPGDRNVLEAMLKHGMVLGGEQSGHIIFLQHTTTGDGLLTALQLVLVMNETGQTVRSLAGTMQPLPQHIVNVEVRDVKRWENPRVTTVIKEAERRLGKNGRMYVRASGTEPVVRIMGESSNKHMLQETVHYVASVIRQEAG